VGQWYSVTSTSAAVYMNWIALHSAVAWRVRRFRRSSAAFVAFLWRRLLVRTTVIAVSGSVGKTTTKELLRAILEDQAPTVTNRGSENHQKFGSLQQTLLRARPWHRFAVIEAGIERPGDMESAARLLKPDIGVMVDVKRSHIKSFRTLENIAAEKSQLIRSLRPSGRAVLNVDNEYVAAMAQAAPCPTVGFGARGDARVRLLDVRSRWPERLSLRIQVDGRDYEVRTRLLGVHWSHAVLAAITTALVCGVPLEDAIASVQRVEPFWARMQPITLPHSGAVIIRDEWKGPADSLEAAFQVLRDATATRRIAVLSDFSDTSKADRARANQLGRAAASFADLAVFVGSHAEHSARRAIANGLPEDSTKAFETVNGAAAYLKTQLRNGDLVLLKGRMGNHLSRIYLSLLGDIACSLPYCPRQILCDRCSELGLRTHLPLEGLVYQTDT